MPADTAAILVRQMMPANVDFVWRLLSGRREHVTTAARLTALFGPCGDPGVDRGQYSFADFCIGDYGGDGSIGGDTSAGAFVGWDETRQFVSVRAV